MRNVFLFAVPLTIAVAGCGSQPKEQAARSGLDRDLKLVSSLRDSAVASPLELGEIRAHPGNTKSLQRAVRVLRHRPARHATIKVAESVRSASTARPVIADISVPSPATHPT